MPAQTDSDARRRPPAWAIWSALALLLVAATCVWIARVRLADMPLGRDEGEYAYMGQLMLDGVPPYVQAHNMKLPGTHAAYAVIMSVFGQTDTGIRYGLLAANALTAMFVFLIARRLFDPVTGSVAAACFVVISFSPMLHGVRANAEQFVILFASAGLWLTLCASDARRWWALVSGGLALGTGMLMKQHGAVFIAAGGLLVIASELRNGPMRWRRLIGRVATFGAAAAAPFVITCLALYVTGAFGSFRFWVFDYATQYVSQSTWGDAWLNLTRNAVRIFGATPALWILAGAGLIVLLVERESRRRAWFVVALLVLSAIAVCPGLYFRKHYFVLMLPVVALLCGVAAGAFVRLIQSRTSRPSLIAIPLLIVAACVLGSIAQQRTLWYASTPFEATRAIFTGNPFNEARLFAEYIRDHSDPTDRIAVLGSEPQIPFYAQRRSATGYIYMYPLMEQHPFVEQFQTEAAEQIAAAKPRYIVYCVNPLSWQINEASNLWFCANWFSSYRSSGWEVVAVAVNQMDGEAKYAWGKDARALADEIWPRQVQMLRQRIPPFAMLLLERKP